MKDGLAQIVGRRIAGVAVARSPRDPYQQVFLVFEDGTCFEFWGENFSCCSGVDQAAGILPYVKSAGGEIVQTLGESLYDIWPSPPGDPSRTRKLYAAVAAIRLIGRAKRR